MNAGQWFCVCCSTWRDKADKRKVTKTAIRCTYCLARRGKRFLQGPPDIPIQERPELPDYIVDAYREACE